MKKNANAEKNVRSTKVQAIKHHTETNEHAAREAQDSSEARTKKRKKEFSRVSCQYNMIVILG